MLIAFHFEDVDEYDGYGYGCDDAGQDALHEVLSSESEVLSDE